MRFYWKIPPWSIFCPRALFALSPERPLGLLELNICTEPLNAPSRQGGPHASRTQQPAATPETTTDRHTDEPGPPTKRPSPKRLSVPWPPLYLRGTDPTQNPHTTDRHTTNDHKEAEKCQQAQRREKGEAPQKGARADRGRKGTRDRADQPSEQ